MKRLILIISALSFLACARGTDDYTQYKISDDNTVDSVHETEQLVTGRWIIAAKNVGTAENPLIIEASVELNGDRTFMYKYFQTVKHEGELKSYAKVATGSVVWDQDQFILKVDSTSCIAFYDEMFLAGKSSNTNWENISLGVYRIGANHLAPGTPMQRSDVPLEAEVRGYKPDITCLDTL